MKKLQSMVSCLIAAVMCLVFTGCSPDPDPEPVVEPISVVGTWEHSYDNGYDLYQFNANGTGKGVSSYGESWTFSYSLNAETMKLVYTEENESAKVWSIEFISDSSIEVDGEWILSKTNKKMEDVKVPSLTGTWRYDFSSGYVYMYFDGKGSGWEQEYDPADGGWHGKDYFKYSYSPSEKEIIFTWDEDGDREEIKVISLSDSELKLLDFMDEGTTIWKFVSKEEVETGKEDHTKRLAQMMEEDYESNGGLYTNIYNFDYNDNGKLVSVTEYDDDGTIDDIYSITYSENTIICTERENNVSEVDNVVTFKLSDGKVIFALEEFSSFSYSHSYSYNSNYLTETTGRSGNATFTWSGDKLMETDKNVENDEDEYIFEYDGQTCKGYNPAIVLFFANKIIYEAKILPLIANPELIGFKTNLLPKSAKCGDEIVHFTYELNDDGYLRKCKIWENDGPSYEAYTFNWE